MGERGRQRLEQYYKQEDMIAAYRQIYTNYCALHDSLTAQ
jgi:hypothetical protein